MTLTSSNVLDYCNTNDSDIYIYSSPIGNGIQAIREKISNRTSKRKNVVLFLSTYGGSADWAYRLASFLNENYEKFSLVITGPCKSAGTLVALGASELHFHKYGELGPLDVQTQKKDDLIASNSGLDVFQALEIICKSSRKCFHNMFGEMISATEGQISSEMASKVATDLSVGIHGAIASKIDPLELGEKWRAVTVAEQYGEILNRKHQNTSPSAINKLINDYPSHSFVINMEEARRLFKNVKKANDFEIELYEMLRGFLLFPNDDVFMLDIEIIEYLQKKEFEITEKGEENDGTGKNGTGNNQDVSVGGSNQYRTGRTGKKKTGIDGKSF